MTNALRILFSIFLALGATSIACSAGETVGPGSLGAGNTTGGAGTFGTGNTTGNAGTTGAGNVTGRGGTTGSGNVTGRGGTTGSGNVTGTAGTSATGAAGTSATGTAGTVGTGTAGTIGTGTAGTTGTGTCSAAFDVAADGFVRAPAAGGACWTGYPFGGGDTGSTIMPTSFMACGAPCMLKVSGMLNAANMANAYAGYAYLGFNLGQAAGATTMPAIMPKGTSITPTFTVTPTTLAVRAVLTGSSGTQYCAPATSGTAIPYSSFMATCWTTGGAVYPKTEGIVSFQISIPGIETAQTITATLTGVKEN